MFDARFSLPTYVMAKPAGALCNLACSYCYYLEKNHLYKNDARRVMSDELLERFIKEYIAMQPTAEVLFNWHGGESLMRPITFYQKAVELQKKYAAGRRIDNAIQTNGTLITDEWAKFFAKNDFLVGVSIDGPQQLHDAHRKSRTGKPSYHQVMQGIRLLNRHDVQWNALSAVNRDIASHPLEVYHFFKSIGCHFIQFTPVVERLLPHADGRNLASPIDSAGTQLAPFSVTPELWGEFLCTIFDEWVRHDVGEVFIQTFDSALARWMGMPPSVCTMAETCGHAAAMEWNGDVYACDHFVFPEFKLGNIFERPLADMLHCPEQRRFGENKRDLLTEECKSCEFLFTCNGECPRLRFGKSADGQSGHNYLCAGYKRFFSHAAPAFDYMKQCLQRNEAPALVMQWLAEGK